MSEPQITSSKTFVCQNCDKSFDTEIRYILHSRCCSLNTRKCSICNEQITKDEYEEHKAINHKKVKCDQCSKLFENNLLSAHKKVCSKKLVNCKYCGLGLNKNNLHDHEYSCGAQTQKCDLCGEYVTRLEFDLHLNYTCKGFQHSLHNSQTKNTDEILRETVRKIGKKTNEEEFFKEVNTGFIDLDELEDDDGDEAKVEEKKEEKFAKEDEDIIFGIINKDKGKVGTKSNSNNSNNNIEFVNNIKKTSGDNNNGKNANNDSNNKDNNNKNNTNNKNNNIKNNCGGYFNKKEIKNITKSVDNKIPNKKKKKK